jgi:hypothetical protein
MAALPEEFRDNPNVVVVVGNKDGITKLLVSADGFTLGVMVVGGKHRGLQVLGASGTYDDHRSVLEKDYKIRMADVAYSGALSRIPDSVLLGDGIPLIFLRDRMGEAYLNIKQYLWNYSIDGDHDRTVN